MLVVIKLQSGEEVIGTLKIEEENSLTLEGALIMRYGYNRSGMPIMYFEKFCMYTKSFDVPFLHTQISHIFKDPLNNISKYYKKTLSKMMNRYNKMADDLIINFEDSDDTMFDQIEDEITKVH